MTTVENQQKFIVPINRETEKIFYNQRMLIDNAVLTEPLAWQVSKVNRISTRGVVVVTLAQAHFNEHTDYIEKDSDGNVIGLWADYYSSSVTPQSFSDEIPHNIYGEFTHTGKDSVLKIGGNYKTYTLSFYDDKEAIDFKDGGTWEYLIDDNDATDLIDVVDLSEGKFKIKFIGSKLYLEKVLLVRYTTPDNIVSETKIEIKAL